jgi:hypothetical protein
MAHRQQYVDGTAEGILHEEQMHLRLLYKKADRDSRSPREKHTSSTRPFAIVVHRQAVRTYSSIPINEFLQEAKINQNKFHWIKTGLIGRFEQTIRKDET